MPKRARRRLLRAPAPSRREDPFVDQRLEQRFGARCAHRDKDDHRKSENAFRIPSSNLPQSFDGWTVMARGTRSSPGWAPPPAARARNCPRQTRSRSQGPGPILREDRAGRGTPGPPSGRRRGHAEYAVGRDAPRRGRPASERRSAFSRDVGAQPSHRDHCPSVVPSTTTWASEPSTPTAHSAAPSPSSLEKRTRSPWGENPITQQLHARPSSVSGVTDPVARSRTCT